MTILPTQNKEWGFWGTAKSNLKSKKKCPNYGMKSQSYFKKMRL